jgi:UDP-perosamine 4-acetyltransferase
LVRPDLTSLTEVIGFGAGGHAKVVIDILQREAKYRLRGLLDRDTSLKGKNVLGVPVLGQDEIVHELKQDGVEYFFIGLGAVRSLEPRRRLYEFALQSGLKPISVIHRCAVVSGSATLGPGVTVMAGVVINAESSVGVNVIVNTCAVVEHDCLIGDHVHISVGARVLGEVKIGGGTMIGAGSIIRQGITVGSNVIVGAGAVVVDNVPDGELVVGVPARALNRKKV